MFPVVVVLVVVVSEEFEAKEVVNRPPKYIDDPLLLGSIVRTAPFRPPKDTLDHEFDFTSHNPTLPPDPAGASNSPPAQT